MFSNEEKTWGMLAHVVTLVVNVLSGFGWVVGLIMYGLKSKESKFIAFHALQASLFQLMMALLFGLSVCLSIFLFILIFPIIMAVAFFLMMFIYPIIGAMKANNGEIWEYPFVGKFCRKAVGI